jgi:hypothetical protein
MEGGWLPCLVPGKGLDFAQQPEMGACLHFGDIAVVHKFLSFAGNRSVSAESASISVCALCRNHIFPAAGCCQHARAWHQ